MITLLNANAIHIPLDDNCVQVVVTSPPYWGLRDYGLPGSIWDGKPGCRHMWGKKLPKAGKVSHGQGGSTLTGGHESWGNRGGGSQGQFCQLCGAWRGCLGLEPTSEMYVKHIVEVFREAWRVMRDDATAWVNLGDSMATGVGANINDLLAARIKEGIILNGSRCSLTITPQRNNVLKNDELAPEHVLTRLFGIKRIFVKQGQDDLCQILDAFTPITDCRIAPGIVAMIDEANSEVVLDSHDGISIIVSQHNLDTDATLKIPIFASTTVNSQTALAVKESSEPITKGIGHIQTTGDTIPLNTLSEGIAQVDSVNNPIAFTDALVPCSKFLCDLRVTKASPEHLAFSLMDGLIKFAFRSVAHLFIPNSYGSLVCYAEVYHQTKQLSNERKAKQELGIPDMVKRALMRDGWICRSTIIWSKTNPMPESVTDRPTRAHEYLFLLSKNKTYFYDAQAVREGNQVYTRKAGGYHGRDGKNASRFGGKGGFGDSDVTTVGRNRRTVWTIATKPYKGAHFATYPPALVSPCIRAGASERGCCPRCRAPWERVVERTPGIPNPKAAQQRIDASGGVLTGGTAATTLGGIIAITQTTGWLPTCNCYRGETIPRLPSMPDEAEPPQYCEVCGGEGEVTLWGFATGKVIPCTSCKGKGITKKPNGTWLDWQASCEIVRAQRIALVQKYVGEATIPCLVLDPFCGSGTTGIVARKEGCDFVGLDASKEYVKMARQRLELNKLEKWEKGTKPVKSNLKDLPLFGEQHENMA